MVDSAAIRAGLASVRDRIARAAERSRRDPAAVRLVAISKTFSADHVRAAADAGHRDFGENKVQEALDKMERTSDLGLRWHLVGHLQSNKAKKAASRFDVIHSVDSERLAAMLDETAATAGREVQLLVQADIAGETTKFGAGADELDAIFAAGRSAEAARIVGLMVLPPEVDEPEAARPYFRALKDIRDRLRARGVEERMLTELSMGMSHDFEVAVEEGATLVRVGTAIFGRRASV